MEPPKALPNRPATSVNFNNLNSNLGDYGSANTGNYGSGSNSARSGSVVNNPYLKKDEFKNIKVFDDNSPSVIRRMGLETDDDDEEDDFTEVKHMLGVGSIRVNRALDDEGDDNDDDDELLMMDLNKVMEAKKASQPVARQQQQPPQINKKEAAKIKKELDFEQDDAFDDEDWLLVASQANSRAKTYENQTKASNYKIETSVAKKVVTKKEPERPKMPEIFSNNDEFDDEDLLLYEAEFEAQAKREPKFDKPAPKSDLKKSYSALSDVSLESSFEASRNQKKRIRLESSEKVHIKDFKLREVMDLISLSIDEDNHEKVFIVKGFIKTLTEPIKQSNMKWIQKCLISDGSYNLEVYIDNLIISLILMFYEV
jgi:hypothetical protein